MPTATRRLSRYTPKTSRSHASEPARKPSLLYQLLALDLDGTLLDPESRISADNRAAVAAAVARGVTVVLASGRAPRHMRDAHTALNLMTPVVAHNGAVVMDLANNHVVHHAPIALPTAREVLNIITRFQPKTNLHVETHHGPRDAWHVQELDARVALFVGKYRVAPPDSVGQIQCVLNNEPTRISKLWFRSPADVMTAIKQCLQVELPGQLETLAFDDVSLTVHATGVSKAAGVAWFAQQMAIPQESVLAIGDEVNDAPLLAWAGMGIAMGNATTEARAAARAVTCSNAEHGVARAIERFLLRT